MSMIRKLVYHPGGLGENEPDFFEIGSGHASQFQEIGGGFFLLAGGVPNSNKDGSLLLSVELDHEKLAKKIGVSDLDDLPTRKAKKIRARV